MALINCKYCGKQISDKARTCPSCGKSLIKKPTSSFFCQECGKLIPIGDDVCPNCGCPVEEINNDLNPQSDEAANISRMSAPDSSKRRVTAIAVIIAIIVGLIIAYHPMKVRLRLFNKWGIEFEKEKYSVQEKANRSVAYASKNEIEDGILRKYRPDILEQREKDIEDSRNRIKQKEREEDENVVAIFYREEDVDLDAKKSKKTTKKSGKEHTSPREERFKRAVQTHTSVV